MVKNWFKLIVLSRVDAWRKRYSVKFLLAASLLACLGLAQVPDDWPITYTVNGYTVVRRSELGPLTGTVNNATFETLPLAGAGPVQSNGPGLDYGSIGNGSDLAVSVSTAGAFSYTVNGYTVVRRSELGPLTGTVNNAAFDTLPSTGAGPVQAIGPGHDYGSIGNGSDLNLSVSPDSAFSYTVNGYTVVRPSELGPLTGTLDKPLPPVGPGHDYGAIGY